MITPEPFVQQCRSLARANNIFLEVVDGDIRLVWTDNGISSFMEWADALGLGITCEMLEEAVSEAGGTIDANSCYPINEAIRRRLGKLLNIQRA